MGTSSQKWWVGWAMEAMKFLYKLMLKNRRSSVGKQGAASQCASMFEVLQKVFILMNSTICATELCVTEPVIQIFFPRRNLKMNFECRVREIHFSYELLLLVQIVRLRCVLLGCCIGCACSVCNWLHFWLLWINAWNPKLLYSFFLLLVF